MKNKDIVLLERSYMQVRGQAPQSKSSEYTWDYVVIENIVKDCNFTEQQLIEEGLWDSIKQGAKSVGGAIKQGAQAVGSAASSAIGKMLAPFAQKIIAGLSPQDQQKIKQAGNNPQAVAQVLNQLADVNGAKQELQKMDAQQGQQPQQGQQVNAGYEYDIENSITLKEYYELYKYYAKELEWVFVKESNRERLKDAVKNLERYIIEECNNQNIILEAGYESQENFYGNPAPRRGGKTRIKYGPGGKTTEFSDPSKADAPTFDYMNPFKGREEAPTAEPTPAPEPAPAPAPEPSTPPPAPAPGPGPSPAPEPSTPPPAPAPGPGPGPIMKKLTRNALLMALNDVLQNQFGVDIDTDPTVYKQLTTVADNIVKNFESINRANAGGFSGGFEKFKRWFSAPGNEKRGKIALGLVTALFGAGAIYLLAAPIAAGLSTVAVAKGAPVLFKYGAAATT